MKIKDLLRAQEDGLKLKRESTFGNFTERTLGQSTPCTIYVLKTQWTAFKAKFGKEPGNDSPLIFDPDSNIPKFYESDKLLRVLSQEIRELGLDEEKTLSALKFFPGKPERVEDKAA
ncbi:MAG TPA: hypothetical protein VGJ94_06830 [Syntrophorhabdaceae bacterium]|jgi:hypothetical protein